MPRTRIQIARQDIIAHFDALPESVFRSKDLAHILSEQRATWRLTQRMRTDEFIEFLLKNCKLRRYKFPFPTRTEERFAWGDVPFVRVLLSLRPNAYFCHYTAVRMHGLTEQIPKTFYLNQEQPRHEQRKALPQEAVDAAFERPQRVSQNVVEIEGVRVCLLNGMDTGMLGVEQREIAHGDDRKALVRVTNLERTLIDIAVRPAYAGGVAEVLNAYSNAKDVVSVNRLTALLQEMNFTYPYHQAIGFYMTRAGYRQSVIDLLRRFPMNVDFYLTHEMKATDYIAEWRLHVPRGF